MGRFDYVKYDAAAQNLQQDFKLRFEELEAKVVADLKSGRAYSLVLTKLEEAYMWIGKAIRDEQIARNGCAEEQPERNNE